MGISPKTHKYTAQIIKDCAIHIIKQQNNNKIPTKFEEMCKICERAKKMYHEKALHILQQNKKMIEHKLTQQKQRTKQQQQQQQAMHPHNVSLPNLKHLHRSNVNGGNLMRKVHVHHPAQ